MISVTDNVPGDRQIKAIFSHSFFLFRSFLVNFKVIKSSLLGLFYYSLDHQNPGPNYDIRSLDCGSLKCVDKIPVENRDRWN